MQGERDAIEVNQGKQALNRALSCWALKQLQRKLVSLQYFLIFTYQNDIDGCSLSVLVGSTGIRRSSTLAVSSL